jgi:hypothetical protein
VYRLETWVDAEPCQRASCLETASQSAMSEHSRPRSPPKVRDFRQHDPGERRLGRKNSLVKFTGLLRGEPAECTAAPGFVLSMTKQNGRVARS